MDGPGNPLVRYWPTLVGVCVAGVVVYALLPEGASPPPPLVTYEDVESPEEAAPLDSPPAAVGRPEYLGTGTPVVERVPPPELQYQTVERPVLTPAQVELSAPRTLTQDDPRVKRALADVPIVLYAPPGDSSVQEVRRYLRDSGLSFREHQPGDPLTSTKASHLRAADGGILVVVDGQELRGFSPGAVQNALTAAVKKRLGDLAGPSVAAP